tara:strand:- start:31966 stop:32100 length:135 start_codon:yes stop_codon:yes gene_type:complete
LSFGTDELESAAFEELEPIDDWLDRFDETGVEPLLHGEGAGFLT